MRCARLEKVAAQKRFRVMPGGQQMGKARPGKMKASTIKYTPHRSKRLPAQGLGDDSFRSYIWMQFSILIVDLISEAFLAKQSVDS